MEKPNMALFPPGDHYLTWEKIHETCVQAFHPAQKRREELFANLTSLLIEVRSWGLLPAEIWIDGSFVTNKLSPRDIDVVMVIHMGELQGLDRTVQDRLYTHFGSGGAFFERYACDVHIVASADSERMAYFSRIFRNFSGTNQYKKKGLIKVLEA